MLKNIKFCDVDKTIWTTLQLFFYLSWLYTVSLMTLTCLFSETGRTENNRMKSKDTKTSKLLLRCRTSSNNSMSMEEETLGRWNCGVLY